MSNNYAIINGEFIQNVDAKIFISDLSIQRGYGIFDYFRSVNYKPVFLEEHLDRFYSSASEMYLHADFNREQIIKLIHQLIEKNNIPDSGIRLTLTGGYSEDGYSIGKPNLIITQAPFHFDKNNFDKGISLISHEHQRQLPHVKTIDYLQAIHLQPLIKKHHADDVLYYNQNQITECPRANFFLVTENDEVLTPSNNILKGITRNKILGFPEFNFREGDINVKDFERAKEAFITSSTKNVLPVLKIDGKKIGEGNPGKITAKIYEKLMVLRGE